MMHGNRAGAQQRAAAPNVVVIQADDLGYGDLSSYGQTMFQTPSLDRLAREGIRFTQYYAGSTVCALSRTALMTGLHTGHTWIRGNGEIALRPEDVGLGRRMMAETARRFVERGIHSFILFAELSNPTLGLYDHMGGERLLDDRGRFSGAYGGRDARALME